MYAPGMAVCEVQRFLASMYPVDLSPDLIRRVADPLKSEDAAWQGRPLEPMYPAVFFDAPQVEDP